MRRLAAMALFLAIALPLAACSPRITAVVPPKTQLVYPESLASQLVLPSEVAVNYRDGSSGLAKVVWDTAGLPERLTADAELLGRIANSDRSVTLQLAVRRPTAEDEVEFWADPPLPMLTDRELAAPDCQEIMLRLVSALSQNPERSIVWSADRQTLAYVTMESFWVWPLGARTPSKLEAASGAGLGGLSHPAWSHDSRWLSVQLGFSSEQALLLFEPEQWQLVRRINIYQQAFWAPDSNWQLCARDGGLEQKASFTIDYTTDLVLVSAETGEERVLLAADEQTLYSALGWSGPDVVRYGRNLNGSYGEGQLAITP